MSFYDYTIGLCIPPLDTDPYYFIKDSKKSGKNSNFIRVSDSHLYLIDTIFLNDHKNINVESGSEKTGPRSGSVIQNDRPADPDLFESKEMFMDPEHFK
jgi:hypothetical protein